METLPESFELLYAVLAGALVNPLVEWLKKKISAKVPIGTMFFSAVLSLAAVAAIDAMLHTGLSLDAIVKYALAAHVTAQGVHGVKKTVSGWIVK